MAIHENLQFDENRACRKCGQDYGIHCGNECPDNVDLREQLFSLRQELEQVKAENEKLREALIQIAKGEGRFSRDPLTHASNTIEDMKALADTALLEKGKKEGKE